MNAAVREVGCQRRNTTKWIFHLPVQFLTLNYQLAQNYTMPCWNGVQNVWCLRAFFFPHGLILKEPLEILGKSSNYSIDQSKDVSLSEATVVLYFLYLWRSQACAIITTAIYCISSFSVCVEWHAFIFFQTISHPFGHLCQILFLSTRWAPTHEPVSFVFLKHFPHLHKQSATCEATKRVLSAISN